jgi:hypothetical protein
LKKSFLKLAALLTLLLCSNSLVAQHNDAPSQPPFSSAPYRVGERLTYHVSFAQFIDAGHIELDVVRRGLFLNREAIMLSAHVKTSGAVNAAILSLDTDYNSYVDPGTGLPFRGERVVRDGIRDATIPTDLNQPQGGATNPGRGGSGEFPGTYDILSALYRARALPLSDGAEYTFHVRAYEDLYEAELKVVGHQLIKTNAGSFNTIVTRLNIKGGQFTNYRTQIYFNDDERHIPVLVTAKSSSGEIRAELAGSQLFVAPPVVAPTPRPTPPVAVRPPLNGQVPTRDSALVDLPFQIGEQLNFQVYIASVTQPVGTATFQVRARSRYFNRDGLLLTVRGQTTNAAQRIFVANDQINSYTDPATLVPFRSEVNQLEGKRRFNRVWTIDQERGIAVGDNGERVEIPVGTYDLASVLYAVRALDLSPGRRNAISLLINNRTRTLFITSLPREVIDLGGQKIPAIHLSLTTDDPQSDKFQLRAWISADSRRLPLRLSAVTEIGPLRADLVILPVSRQ